MSGNLAIWTVHALEKVLNSRFYSEFQRQMILMVSSHHGGIPMQISINLGKTFPHISWIRKAEVTWILARVFAYLPSFFSEILDFIYWTVLIFILIYFEWRDTENQQ